MQECDMTIWSQSCNSTNQMASWLVANSFLSRAETLSSDQWCVFWGHDFQKSKSVIHFMAMLDAMVDTVRINRKRINNSWLIPTRDDKIHTHSHVQLPPLYHHCRRRRVPPTRRHHHHHNNNHHQHHNTAMLAMKHYDSISINCTHKE